MSDSDSLNGIVFILASIHSLFKGSIQPSNASYGWRPEAISEEIFIAVRTIRYWESNLLRYSSSLPLEIGLWGDLVS
jgi:hypothetical protein